MNIRLIIFDFDGTLGDTRRNIVMTLQQAMQEMHLPVIGEAQCAATIGLTLKNSFKTLFPQLTDEEAEDVTKPKPDPEPVLKTLSALGFAADATLVVGDMPVDILMGRNAGTRTINADRLAVHQYPKTSSSERRRMGAIFSRLSMSSSRSSPRMR